MGTKKEAVKRVAKIAVGLLLVFYVLQSKMVDFKALGTLLFSPKNFLIGMFFLTLSMLACSFRWWILMRAQGLALTWKQVVSLTMIGNFFNTFMPGSVGGDLIKAWYIAGSEPKQKTKSVMTVLVDRVIGLAVIVFYAASAMLFYLSWLEKHHELQLVAYSVWLFTAASALFCVFFFIPAFWKIPLFAKTVEQLRNVRTIGKVVDSVLAYRHKANAVFNAIILSSFSILSINILYYIQGNAIGIPMTLSEYFFVAPIALVVSAIPLLPGGIGTGQVAFFTLFSWMGMQDPNMGGSLATIVQIYTILFNCFGAVFYLRHKRKPRNISPLENISLSHSQAGRIS